MFWEGVSCGQGVLLGSQVWSGGIGEIGSVDRAGGAALGGHWGVGSQEEGAWMSTVCPLSIHHQGPRVLSAPLWC